MLQRLDTPTPTSQLPGHLVASAVQKQRRGLVAPSTIPKSHLGHQMRFADSDSSSFTASEFASDHENGNNNNINNNNNNLKAARLGAGKTAPDTMYRRATYADENQDPGTNHSLGYGDAGMGLGMDDKERFLDLHSVRKPARTATATAPTWKRTRVDDNSDVTADGDEASSSDDEFSVRLGLRPGHGAAVAASTPHPRGNRATRLQGSHAHTQSPASNNASKSAFDGLARELRREFKRIEGSSPPAVLANKHRTPFKARSANVEQTPLVRQQTALKRNDAAPRYQSIPHNPVQPARTFGQELPLYSQPARQQPPAKQQSYQLLNQPTQPTSFSPFQVSPAPLPCAGTAAPHNSRATASSIALADRASDRQTKQSNARLQPDRMGLADVTGLTDAISSPSRIASGPSSHRDIPSASLRQVRHGEARLPNEDVALSSALSSLRKRLELLETENVHSEAKVRELERQLAENHAFPATVGPSEDLVPALRDEIERLQASIHQQAAALADLQDVHRSDHSRPVTSALAGGSQQWANEFNDLRAALFALAEEVGDVKRILERVLASLTQPDPTRSPRDKDLLRRPTPGLAHYNSSPGMLERGQYARSSAAPVFSDQPQNRASSAPLPDRHTLHRVQRIVSNAEHASEPLLDRAERILSSLPPSSQHPGVHTCEVCAAQLGHHNTGALKQDLRPERPNARQSSAAYVSHVPATLESSHRLPRVKQNYAADPQPVPMQAVISRALRELEDDFASHKQIFIELSDEYKAMDPAMPDVGKRQVLAIHLKESIDVLECKANEIKRVYDLLHYSGESTHYGDRV